MQKLRALLAIALVAVIAMLAPRVVRRARLNFALVDCMKQLSHGSQPCRLPDGDLSDRSRYHHGMNALRAGDARGAVASFRSLVNENPRDELAGYFLGEAYRAAGDDAAAIAAWRQAGSMKVFRNRAWWHGSISDFETAIAIGGVDAPTYYRFGDALFESGDFKRSRDAYAGGLKADPNPQSASALGATGRVAEIDGDFPRAAMLYERALQLDPNDAAAYFRLASVLARRLHEPAKALTWCERSIEKTHALTGYLCAAEVSRDRGDYAAAIQWANQGAVRFPKQSAIFISKGHTYEAAGDLKSADSEYVAAGQLEPSNFWIPYYRAQVALKSGNSDRAIAQLWRSLTLNPTSTSLYLELGDEYRRVGKLDAAADSFRNALRLDPRNLAATQALNSLTRGDQLQIAH